MRIRKRSIRGRVKGDLSIAFTEEALSAHGGLELIRRFLDRSGFIERLRKLLSIRQFESDYGSLRMTLLLIAMLIIGGRRLRHLGYLEQDPIVRRFAGLHQLPTDRTVSHWLKDLGPGIHGRLKDLLRELTYDSARHAGSAAPPSISAVRSFARGCWWMAPRGASIPITQRTSPTTR